MYRFGFSGEFRWKHGVKYQKAFERFQADLLTKATPLSISCNNVNLAISIFEISFIYLAFI